jgi:RNA polymerase sigma-70 factor, ECF subfamily
MQCERAVAPWTGAAEEWTDEDVVARVLDGDTELYAVLVRRHQDRLFRHALGMVLDRDTASDLVQDAFVAGYTRLGSCRDASRFGTWIFQILRNRCLDHLKERRRRDVPLAVHHHPVTRDGPATDFERGSLRDVLDGALATLPEAQREAFLLKHVEELTYEEMAEVVGASESALRMRVLRAREALQLLLRDEIVPAGMCDTHRT